MSNPHSRQVARRSLLQAALAAPLVGLARPSWAQSAYPSRVARVIVPWAPGGAVDTLARRMAQKLTEGLGQNFVVENKSGATGTIGAAEAARSAPDGYTLLAIDNTYAMLPYLFSRLPFDQATAFQPITVTAFSPVLLAVGEKSPYRDLASLIAAAKKEPEKLTYGTGGIGSAPHFSTLAFEHAAGVKLYHVPFRGAGEAVIGVLSGNVDLVMLSPGSALGNSGRATPSTRDQWGASRCGLAGRPHLHRGWATGLQRGQLVWPRRPQGHARRDRRAPARGRGARPGDARYEGLHHRSRFRAWRHLARCFLSAAGRGSRALARRRGGRRHRAAVG